MPSVKAGRAIAGADLERADGLSMSVPSVQGRDRKREAEVIIMKQIETRE
jgi:hypothetical protein